MKELEINIYEAYPILVKMLNVSGFCTKMLNKNSAWLNSKYRRSEFYTVVPGFNQADVELINCGLQAVAEFCTARLLKPISGCNDADIYSQYASQRIKELRAIISVAYLQEKHTSMAKDTFSAKVRMAINKNGKPNRFTEKDIEEINGGLLAMAGMLSKMKVAL